MQYGVPWHDLSAHEKVEAVHRVHDIIFSQVVHTLLYRYRCTLVDTISSSPGYGYSALHDRVGLFEGEHAGVRLSHVCYTSAQREAEAPAPDPSQQVYHYAIYCFSS
jgi:hypothetical protein